MSNKRTVDAFRVSAAQVAFSGRRKGITAPNVQAAVEEIMDKLDHAVDEIMEKIVDEIMEKIVDEIMEKIDEIDHSHRGEGENSVQLGPDSIALADSSIALGHNALTRKDDRYNAEHSVALGHNAGAHSESSVAIGYNADAIGENDIAIGAYATAYGIEGSDEGPGDAIAIGYWAFAEDKSVAIGSDAEANFPLAIAIGATSNANDEHAIAIGTDYAQANMPNTISIGRFSQANWNNAVAIGPFTESNDEGGIALGDSAKAHSEASISIGQNTMTWGGENIAIGKDAEAYSERSVAIGSGSLALADNSMAIGPGVVAEETNTIVLGTADHIVIIPGELKVLGGMKTNISWIAPSDDVIAEMSTPLQASQDDAEIGIDQKSLTLRNPGRYRIKGYIDAGNNAWARFEILENGEPIVETVFVNESSQAFSLDFNRDIGVNTTLTFRLEVGKIVPGQILPVTATVSEIRVCGTETDIGNGVIGW